MDLSVIALAILRGVAAGFLTFVVLLIFSFQPGSWPLFVGILVTVAYLFSGIRTTHI